MTRPQPAILHLIAGAPHGGAETFCLDTILALHGAGVRQHVICRPHPAFVRGLTERGIPFTTLGFNLSDRGGRGGRVIAATVAHFAPDVVHAWMGRAASFVPRGLTMPVLGWFGGYYDLKRYHRCDFHMGVSRDIVRHIVAYTGKPHRAFLNHTCGVLDEAEPADRTALQTPANAPVVLLLSRMHHKKGVDTLLQAAVRLPGVYFWLAGDGPELGAYRHLAAMLGLGDRVRFLGWRNDRAGLLQAADLCVLPSRYEPFGTVIAEAWQARRPLVATMADGARQYVTHDETGLLCAIDDSAGLAGEIRRGLTDQTLRRHLIRQGHLAYQASFSKEVMLRELIQAYRAMVAAGKTSLVVPLETDGVNDSTLVTLAHEDGDDGSGDCACVAQDVGMLQQGKVYDFLRRDWFGRATACEIWSAGECDRALANLRLDASRAA